MASETKPAGVYRNKRLMHACTTIVGSTVRLQTKDGSVWEGIFNTFSPEFTICLKLAIQIDPKLNPKDCLYAALKAGHQAEKQAFFDLKDIVRITVLDVDLNYAAGDLTKLATDADISGFDANKTANAKSRQLESWQDDDEDTANADSMLSLDDVALGGNKIDSQNNSRGWDAQEMFRYNERVHKVTTTYDEKLSDYTVPLPKHSTKEWRKKQERAAAIAREIEGNSKSQGRLAKEDDGDCEEEKFSAVVRPTPPPATSRPQPPPPSATSRPQPPPTSAPAPTVPVTTAPAPTAPVTTAPATTAPPTTAPPTTAPSTTAPPSTNIIHNKNFSRPRVSDRERSRIDSLKNFGTKLSLGPIDHQSELARKSTLNPNAKEFVYKPRSPAAHQTAQTNGANQVSTNAASAIDPNNSSPMSQAPHGGNYYHQIPMFPHGLSPHQQPHHAAQFMPNHAHPHFQNPIHYMTPVPPHFAQQMPQRYIRSNFQNYHHRGEHHNNVRADYSQASMMAPTSTGQPFVPSPSGAPHPMNAYAPSPQQPMIYSGPHQPMYPVVQAGFPQHMPHVMTNPPPYDGSTVYMPSQNYIVNP